MKTRDQIYHREGEKLLRFLTTYHALKYEQVMKMFGNQDSIKSLITSLVKQGRIYHDKEAGLLCDSPEAAKNPDRGTIAAYWILKNPSYSIPAGIFLLNFTSFQKMRNTKSSMCRWNRKF